MTDRPETLRLVPVQIGVSNTRAAMPSQVKKNFRSSFWANLHIKDDRVKFACLPRERPPDEGFRKCPNLSGR